MLALARRVLGLNLGHARKALRPLAGIAPELAPARASRPSGSVSAEMETVFAEAVAASLAVPGLFAVILALRRRFP